MKLHYILGTLTAQAAILLSVLSSTAVAVPLTNGDFQAGLSSWTSTPGVSTTVTEEALLQDVQYPVQLFQGFDMPLQAFTLEFDFLNELAFIDFQNDPFAFQDVVFATLYATNDIAGFDLNVPSGTWLPLLDVDYSGGFTLDGDLSASSAKPGWAHFSISIDPASFAAYQFGLLAFELLDFNSVASDSAFYVDNVAITEVPEPASLSLLGLGAVALGYGRKRKSRAPFVK